MSARLEEYIETLPLKYRGEAWQRIYHEELGNLLPIFRECYKIGLQENFQQTALLKAEIDGYQRALSSLGTRLSVEIKRPWWRFWEKEIR